MWEGRMKMLALVAVLQFGGGWALYPPTASAQQALVDEPGPALKSCISTNAPAVERVFDDLNEGVTFLVQKVCVSHVADQMIERNKQQAAEQKARMDAMCKAQASSPPPNPNPKPDDPLPDFNSAFYLRQMCQQNPIDIFGPDFMQNIDSLFWGGGAGIGAPKAEALAAQTLLKLRVERLPKGRQ
jgi:hypothetical protein